MHFRQWTALVAVVGTLSAHRVQAQNGLHVLAALGYASTEGNVMLGKSAKQIGIEVGFPVIPFAVRGDALLFGGKYDPDALSYNLNAVLLPRFPVVRPYGIVGRGSYAKTLSSRTDGWNYGAGVRVTFGRLGAFAEYRRHAPAGRSVTAVGVMF